MDILIVDAQGGGIGKQLVTEIKKALPNSVITACGTNSLATSSMLKAGADIAATGENAIIVNARKAKIIVGVIGIVIADSLHGEITSKMANAIATSDAKRILIPMNQCNNFVVGVENLKVSKLIQDVIDQLKSTS